MADLTVKGDATNGSKRYKITFAEGSGTKENLSVRDEAHLYVNGVEVLS